MLRRPVAISLLLLCLALPACKTTSVDRQVEALTLSADARARREANSRRFETTDERMIQSACAAVLQDLGFTMENSSVGTGLLVASKDRDAVEAQQVAGQMFLAVLVAALGGTPDPVWERDQRIRISVVTRPQKSSIVVSASVQRVIRNTKNQISRVETINEPTIHQYFFDRLSQSVFLEAHEI